jgi:transcriptional regulator with GAF, ATPase, and Fis domain
MLKYLGGQPEEPEPDQETGATSWPEEANKLSPSQPSADDSDFAGEGEPLPNREPAMEPENELDRNLMLEQKIEGLEKRIGYLERIVKVSQILNSTLSLEPLLQIIIQAATELTNTEACSIMLIDKHTGELRFAEATGGTSETLKKVSVPLDNSIGGWVVRKDRPLLIRDAKNDPRWHRGVDETTDFETHSILGVPLKVRDEVIGVLEVVNKKSEDGFNQDDIQIATTLSAQAAIAIENARLLDELQQAYR